MSLSALNKLIRKLENLSQGEPTFEALFKKAGRKMKNKDSLHTKIRDIMGNDNSLTLRDCKEKLENEISIAQFSKEIKKAGLSRKRIKKRSNVVLNHRNIDQRQAFCSAMSEKISKRVVFLDESGYNLHTSTNYGYLPVSQDAVLYQQASRGRNISLCSIISTRSVEHFKLIDGGFNRDSFEDFLVECNQKNVFTPNTVLVLDNVKFYHCIEIKTYSESIGVEVFYLPAYSPDLNPIENLFRCTKQRLDGIRPRKLTSVQLKANISMVIEVLGSLLTNIVIFGRK